MAKVELKAPIVQEISELLDGATAAVLVDYRGITVEKDTQLRKELRTNDVTYRVYKNTLLNIAMKGTPFEALSGDLNGPTAIAVTKKDATVPARIITTFDKKGEMIQLKAGVVDGTYYDQKGINAVALIPGREVLLGRLFGSMKSPISNFARVLKQIAEQKEA
ncbi:MAG: 50S ribosomal protein L10 [Lachnospiraceae bacterium]|jgi:large subunit ribosomal protein L10|nr:50S ribosomal protein L10 [Lachnospiraceae bacterium]